MSKKYIKNIVKSLIGFLESHNFKYLEEKQQFIGFNESLVFRCSFDIGGYGSRLEFNLDFDCPITRTHMDIFPKYFMRYGASSTNKKWIFKNFDINFISQDIQFVFYNYFYNLISKSINMYNLEKYIQEEYENRFREYLDSMGEEDPSLVYTLEFLESGKNQFEWSKIDDEKCEELVKEKQDKEFQYEKIKQEILHDAEANEPEYHKTIEDVFGKDSKELKFNNKIFSISAEEICKNISIQEIIKKYGFEHNPNKNTQGDQNYGDTIYFKRDDCELFIIVAHEIFLEFVLIDNANSKHITLYDGDFGFSFGWLVGEESIRDENINSALEELKKSLNSIVT